MTKTIKYRLNFSWVCWILLTPLLSSMFLILAIMVKIKGPLGINTYDYFAWPFLFILFVGVDVYLFINHFRIAKNTEIYITYRDFEILQYGNHISGHFTDITRIVEYAAPRMPWFGIVKWELTVAEQTVLLSSLTISKSSFDRYFYNKIEQRFEFLPRIVRRG